MYRALTNKRPFNTQFISTGDSSKAYTVFPKMAYNMVDTLLVWIKELYFSFLYTMMA